MTAHEAKDILMRHRPGTEDANDPDMVEALARVRQSEELERWFEFHCAVQHEIRNRLRNMPVPEGLREQIISERRSRGSGSELKNRLLLVAVAVLVSLGIIFAVRLSNRPTYVQDDSFAAYRTTMVGMVLRTYSMDLETDNLTQIRSFFARHQSVADWVLPKPLEQITRTGCGILSWQGRPVSMICFHSGKPLGLGEKTDIFLFVVESSSLTNKPEGPSAEVAQVGGLATASWSADGKTYVLATEGDSAYIRRFL